MSRHCFVPGCNTGYTNMKLWNKKHGQRNPSLFKPRTDEKVKIWENAIRRTGASLTQKDVVCELHFLESDIQRFYTTKLSNGTVFRLKRGHPKLKENAIPTIFSTTPWYLNKPTNRCKLPTQRNTSKRKIETKAMVMNTKQDEPVLEVLKGQSQPDNQPIQLKEQNLVLPSHQSQKFTKEDLSAILLPQGYWFSCVIDDKIGFTRCSDDLSLILKRVVLHADLTIDVFFYERKLFIEGLHEVENISCVSSILNKIDKLTVCPGANDYARSKGCVGYVERTVRCRDLQIERCLLCKKYRERLE